MMAQDRIQSLLRNFDHAREHAWESLVSTIQGLTADEARWQAPCYSTEPVEEGWPLPGSIQWQLAHIRLCKTSYANTLVESRGLGEAITFTPAESLEEELHQLESVHARQRAAIEAFSDDDLTRELPTGSSLEEFIISTTRHDIWHAAQIALLRRLWKQR